MIHRKNILPALIAGSILLTVSFAQSVPAREQAMKLSDLAFLAGRWTGEIKAGKIEQEWSAARADLMMGMFHLYNGDKTLVLEFMSLRQTPNGIVLQVRHF